MSSAERQKQTARAFVDGYNRWTMEGLLGAKSKDCIHRMLPASLGMPDADNAAFEEKYRPLMPLITNYKMTVHKTFHDIEARTVILHASGSADTPVGPYENEYVWFLKMSESGDEIVEVQEMLDTAFVGRLFPKVYEFISNRDGGREDDGANR